MANLPKNNYLEPVFTTQELLHMNTSILRPKTQIWITLVHKGGEQKIVEVTGVEGRALFVAWPMSGVYKLDLQLNQLIPKSKKGFSIRLWGASDLAKCWEIWNDLNQIVGIKRRT